MAKGGKLATEAMNICKGTIEKMGLDLVNVDFVKEGKHQILRFYVDKRGGVNLDDCAELSRAINPLLDDSFSWSGPYLLEVSSPGLDRPLKTLQDLRRHIDEEVDLRFYRNRDGKKEVRGFLKGVTEDHIVLELSDESGKAVGPKLTIELIECAKISRSIRF